MTATTGRQVLSKEQRDAIFASVAATMQPARPSAANELLEWKPQIMAYYAKGYSAAQIRDMLQAGHVTIHERMVQRFIAKHSHRKRAASPRRAAAVPAPTATSPDTNIPPPRQSADTGTTAARQPTAKVSSRSAT